VYIRNLSYAGRACAFHFNDMKSSNLSDAVVLSLRTARSLESHRWEVQTPLSLPFPGYNKPSCEQLPRLSRGSKLYGA
jgi:hypothetical protein